MIVVRWQKSKGSTFQEKEFHSKRRSDAFVRKMLVQGICSIEVFERVSKCFVLRTLSFEEAISLLMDGEVLAYFSKEELEPLKEYLDERDFEYRTFHTLSEDGDFVGYFCLKAHRLT